MRTSTGGFSILEILLAGALLLVFSAGATTVALAALDHTRLGEEEATAVRYASSGLEIVRSIRNRSFDGLSETGGSGTDVESGVWMLAGEDDSFGKYMRTIIVREASRDGDGNIVEEGGTSDPDTLLVTSRVVWDFTPSRREEVEISTYLTRFQDPL